MWPVHLDSQIGQQRPDLVGLEARDQLPTSVTWKGPRRERARCAIVPPL
jgi:hypothetical protein